MKELLLPVRFYNIDEVHVSGWIVSLENMMNSTYFFDGGNNDIYFSIIHALLEWKF